MANEALEKLVEILRENPVVTGDTVQEQRANMKEKLGAAPRPEGVTFTPVDAGGVPAEWTEAPGASDERTVVYFHGGGYVMGGIETHRLLVASISAAAEARVLSVDYRLAPEDPHPAAVEDALAAYRFARESGAAPERTAFGGDSAGGGLTAATLLAARDAGDPLPAAAVLISPWLDLALEGESMESKEALDPMLGRESLGRMAEAYLGGADAKTPTASPLHGDLAGLPPLLLHVGERETLLDDSTRFGERARAAGVDAEVEVWKDMIHVWHAFDPVLPESGQAIAKIGEFLRKRLG